MNRPRARFWGIFFNSIWAAGTSSGVAAALFLLLTITRSDKLMKYTALILLLSLGLCADLRAQPTYNSSGARMNARPKPEQKKGFDKNKLIYGGGFSFNFFNGAFSAGLAPIVGYRISERFAAGIGLGYLYASQKDAYQFNTPTGFQSLPLRRHLITPSAWARFLVLNNIFVHVEGEYNVQNWRFYSQNFLGEPEKRRLTVQSPALLVGGGLRQPIAEYSSLYIMALYDVLQDPNSPYYRNGIDIRAGLNIGW